MEEVICKNCGSIDDYRTEISNIHLKATCNSCDRFIKFVPQNNTVDIMPFGKYKGREIATMTEKEEVGYLTWAVANLKLSSSIKSSIENHIKYL